MTVPEVNQDTQTLSRVTASKFADKWKDTIEEQQHSQAFWQDFFREVIGVTDLQGAGIEFEKKVTSSKKGTTTRIDVFWKDTFLVEQKSAGKDLDAAEEQARDYVVSLPPALRPPVVIVCDFARFRIVDILLNKSHEFKLEELPDNLHRIEAVVNHKTNVATQVQVEADQKAAQLMADLYIQLEKYGYEGHEASVFMVRILFCLFADDTRMWKTNIFYDLVNDTNPSGADLGPRLANLFVVLDTPKDERRGPQDALMADFPYVNGGIFSERLETINFNSEMRKALVNACHYDWSSINPTIFGALFQDIKSKDERRANGEHYTTEANIDKTIKPLFLDELHEKLETAWDYSGKLKELQRELGTYQILDPACGCGNFLITTYKRLRELELDIIVRLKQLEGTAGQTSLFDVAEDIHVKLEQLHGIEYVEWSAQIAQVAIYLTDHQENMKLEKVLGVAANRFPLSHSAKIVRGNSLQLDWNEICPSTEKTIVIGNPPFLNSSLSHEQKSDHARIWQNSDNAAGSLDYVCNWYLLAARFIQGTKARAAFVSTSSITQGVQPAILWGELEKYGIHIDFAHRSFVWESDASGKAAVFCVIIGFSAYDRKVRKLLFSYKNAKSAPTKHIVDNINAYLLDAPNVLIYSRRKPLVEHVPSIVNGSKPTDDGYLSNIKPEEAEAITRSGDLAGKYLRRIVGSQELINGIERYCLWLVDAPASELRASSEISFRVQAVQDFRLKSTKLATRESASTPWLFQEIRYQDKPYLALPEVSGENRDYVPVAYLDSSIIATNKIQVIPNAELHIASILFSKVFMIWVSSVSGRLGNSFSISAQMTYNNFPFPLLSSKTKDALSRAVREVIDIRGRHSGQSLADLYDPKFTPKDLRQAHLANDKLVLEAFALQATSSDSVILKKLLVDYQNLIHNSENR